MRWVWTLVALFAFAAMFQVDETWIAVVAFGVGIAALVAAFFAFAAARVGAVVQSQSDRELDVLIAARSVAERQGTRASATSAPGSGSPSTGSLAGSPAGSSSGANLPPRSSRTPGAQ